MSELIDIAEKVREFVFERHALSQRSISERTVAESLGVKRGTAREALLQLEAEGILRRKPKIGYEIVDYHSANIVTILTLRLTIEQQAMRIAVTSATREDLVRLTLIQEEMEATDAADFHRVYCLDRDFHRSLVQSAHDPLLKNMYKFLQIPIICDKSHPYAGDLAATAREHATILAALKRRDSDALQAAITSHIGKHLTIWQQQNEVTP